MVGRQELFPFCNLIVYSFIFLKIFSLYGRIEVAEKPELSILAKPELSILAKPELSILD